MPCHYVGFEYSKTSSLEAVERYKGIDDLNVPGIFIIGDVGDEKNTIDKILLNEKFKDIKYPITFDIVSC